MQKLQFQSGSKSEMMKHLASRIYMPGLERNLEASLAFVGNGGMDKLIGVEGEGETISADEAPVFDDYMRGEQYERE